MSAGRSASFCLVVCLLLCTSEAQKTITAVVGQEVTLPCKVNNNKTITAVKWSRTDLDPEYVLLYRDDRLDPDYQLPSYVNRVDLQDREMKDGDVSMILKDVKMEDRGTYECLVFQRETNRMKRSTTKSINRIYLDVGPSGDKDGGNKDGGDKDGGDEAEGHKAGGDKDGGDKVGGDKDGGDKDGGGKDGNTGDGGNKVGIILGVVGLILLLLVASVGFLVYRRHKRQNSNLHVPPDEAADKQMLQFLVQQQTNSWCNVVLHHDEQTVNENRTK